MIISASRRTDIPAFYSRWFLNRIREKYVLVRNPYNPKAISKISLAPEVIDCLVFWTKNPAPMIGRLDQLQDYSYYFQFTLNPYGPEIETHLPPLATRLDTFKRLSDKIGKQRVIWRYDPIFTNGNYTTAFHQENFARMAEALKDHTESCMLGFIDLYRHIRSVASRVGILPLSPEEIMKTAVSFKETADHYGIRLNTCTAKIDLSELNIPGRACIDSQTIEQVTGYPITAKRDKNQRELCRCTESIDIGAYDSCLNGCLYCYAVKEKAEMLLHRTHQHNPTSPLLIGNINPEDTITERPLKSFRTDQFSLWTGK